MSHSTIFLSQCEEDTKRVGKEIFEQLPSQCVVSLVGTLGAGKTRLVQAIANAAGVNPEEVSSPTYVLIHEYISGVIPIFHFDVYRLKNEEEFLELGPEEYFERSGISLLEWGDRITSCLPKDHIQIEIEILGNSTRKITLLTGNG